MAKTLIAKIIIATSTVVVVGGAATGAILIPKYIEQKQEKQRQEQIRQENEADLANISIKLKKDKYEMPLNGVTMSSNLPQEEQGHIETEGTVDVNTVGTYTIKYKYVPKKELEKIQWKEKMTKEHIK